MMQEESMELSLAIFKKRRGETDQVIEDIHEEFADVLIMVEQCKTILDGSKVQKWIDFKINRLSERLSK